MLRQFRGKPITYTKRSDGGNTVKWGGESICIILPARSGKRYVCILTTQDRLPGTVTGVDGFSSKYHCVEYALKAMNQWEPERTRGDSMLTSTVRQQHDLDRMFGVAEAARILRALGFDPEAVATLEQEANARADRVTDSFNKNSREVEDFRDTPKEQRKPMPYRLLRPFKYEEENPEPG